MIMQLLLLLLLPLHAKVNLLVDLDPPAQPSEPALRRCESLGGQHT